VEFSAVSIAGSVAAGDVLPSAVLAEHVRRYRQTHGSLNALVQPRHTSAADEARLLESQLRAGVAAGPLAGVPVSVKECFAVAGLVTSLGIPSRCQHVDSADAAIVERLRSAGALVVGKANVPQAMYLHETDNPVWGRTNHPLDAGRGPGGSSGGDAALVAAGVVPLAVGTDLAGSIRQPAHACGIAGFLPRTSTLGGGGAFDTMPELKLVRARAGFLSRTVADLDRGFRATCGRGGPGPEPARAVRRVGWWDQAGPIEPSPAVRRAVHEAAGRLAQAGVEVVPVDGRLAEEAAWLMLAILSADGAAQVRRLFVGTRPMPPVARLLRLAGLPVWLRPVVAAVAQAAGSSLEGRALRATGPRRGAAFEALVEGREDLARRFATLAGSCDAVLCPVSALPALRHGTASRLLLAAAPCLLANLLDVPAGAVPVTRVRPEEESGRGGSRDPVMRAVAATDRGSRGLPVGVQVIGVPAAVPGQDPLLPERIVLDCMGLVAADGRER
jgi:fatty acid amide hydrolase